MQHLEVSAAVRHIYIYIYIIYVVRQLRVNCNGLKTKYGCSKLVGIHSTSTAACFTYSFELNFYGTLNYVE